MASTRQPLWLVGLMAIALTLSCQQTRGLGAMPSLGIDLTPATLLAPQGMDWTLQRVSGKRLATEQQAYFQRHALAFPTASTNWSAGPGVALSALGATGDTVPNAPAAAFRTNPADPLYNKLFFLTKGGKFIKVDKANPATFTTYNVGGTFSRTCVTLSPASSRAYLLSDSGTLTIVNTITMTPLGSVSVAGGYGIAPYYDPYRSSGQDLRDELYVPGNDGNVSKYVVTATSATSAVTISSPTTYPVATGSAAVSGRKVAASAIVLDGVIYMGDQGGNWRTYDTANPANNLTFGVGAPVDTAPAIEIQDGSYALTDPSGAPKAVAPGTPIYAFVSAGPACYWLNLHDASSTPSLPLRVDDNDNAQFGTLLNYNFSNSVSTERIACVDGGNLNTDAAAAPANRILPNYTASWCNDELIPAETNVYDDGTQAAGGPVVSYMRWNSSATYPANSIVTSAQLSLEVVENQGCRVPEIRTTSPYYQGTATLWASNGLTTANRPAVGAGNVGSYLSGGVNGVGNVGFNKNKQYLWDVTAAIATPASKYALSLVQKTPNGDAVMWPYGPYNAATGKKAKKAYQVDAVRFKNNPLNADASAAVNKDSRPTLTLNVSTTVLPTATIETPPVIDAINHRVYVFYTNTLYSLDFNDPSYWADADPAGTAHTLYQIAYYGNTANNPAGVGGTKPGATFNNNAKFVGNYSAPLPNYNLTAMYVLSRSPATDGAAPTSWKYALSKISLPLTGTANRLVAGSPTFAAVPGQTVYTGAAADKESCTYLAIDPFVNSGTTGDNVYFALGNGRVYQYDR